MDFEVWKNFHKPDWRLLRETKVILHHGLISPKRSTNNLFYKPLNKICNDFQSVFTCTHRKWSRYRYINFQTSSCSLKTLLSSVRFFKKIIQRDTYCDFHLFWEWPCRGCWCDLSTIRVSDIDEVITAGRYFCTKKPLNWEYNQHWNLSSKIWQYCVWMGLVFSKISNNLCAFTKIEMKEKYV